MDRETTNRLGTVLVLVILVASATVGATQATHPEQTTSAMAATTADAAVVDAATTDPSGYRGQAVYVWGYALTLVTDANATDRFFERAAATNITRVYLSWGTIKYASESERAAFIERAHNNSMEVHALVGKNGADAASEAGATMPEILSDNDGRDDSAQFDGIHLNIEPAGADLDTFFDDTDAMLDGARTEISGDGATIESQNLSFSLAVGWWWHVRKPDRTEAVVEHPSLDYVVVMSYFDSEEGVRRRAGYVVSETDTPYAIAIETQEFPQGTTPENVTFYEEGQAAAEQTFRNLATDPPSSEYLGGTYHFYQSSVSTWQTLRGGTVSTRTLQRGESVSVTVDVAFDDIYPRESHRSDLVARVSGGGQSYGANVTVEPPGSELSTETVTWTPSSDVPNGTYAVTAVLNDTTFENRSRHPVATRDVPVTLDTMDLGTLTVGDGTVSTFTRQWDRSRDSRLQYADVAVADGRTFAAGLGREVTAYDAATGSVDWTFRREGSLVDSAPATARGNVYVGSGAGILYALDQTDGSVVWTLETGSAIVSGPTVVDGTVYAATSEGTLYAADAASGAVEWSTDVGGPVYADPTVASGTVYVGTDSGTVTALSTSTGTRLWERDFETDLGRAVPVVSGESVFVSGDELHAIDADTGSTRWNRSYNGSSGTTPVVADGTVYVADEAGTVRAFDAATGSSAWRYSVGSPLRSSVALVDGAVVVGTTAGDVLALDSRTGIPAANTTVSGSVSTAVSQNGAVYLGAWDGHVYALGTTS